MLTRPRGRGSPHQPEACGFASDTFVDITAVWARKQAAMAAMGSQRYLAEHYAERSRQRAVQSRYAGAGRDTRQVEVFQRLTPELRELLGPTSKCERLDLHVDGIDLAIATRPDAARARRDVDANRRLPRAPAWMR